MITNISIVSVFVKDVDESKRFYTDVLGFEAKDDITLGEGYRWWTVRPRASPNRGQPGRARAPAPTEVYRGDEARPGRGRHARPRSERR